MTEGIMVTSCINVHDLCQDLVWQMTREQQLEFVKEFDLLVADYDFTRVLRDYFESEVRKEIEYDLSSY